MLYEKSFLEKTLFEENTIHGGGGDACSIAGFPALKHLSVPLGLVFRPMANASFISGDAILDVMDYDKYDTLYEKILDTKGKQTKRQLPKMVGLRKTKKAK
jgi:hypothetical protein